jgi:uncharacterized repeat protein (TIGR03803 family)
MLTTLHSFKGADEGIEPESALILGRDGALYGTTVNGGDYELGAVYRVNPDGSNLQTLHSFNGADGKHPVTALIQGADGALYGTAQLGGANNGLNNSGTVFKLNTDGTGFQVLHIFNNNGTEGRVPHAPLIQGSDGALYGTNWLGGVNNNGTVFKLNPDGSGFQMLYSFSGSDGSQPNAALAQGSDGALYGSTVLGGANNGGTLFKLNIDGSGFQTLHNFNGSDGKQPSAALIQSIGGTLYGTTVGGGANNDGVVFKLNTDGTGFQSLHSFSGADGSSTVASLVQGSDGALYGTTYSGGANSFGAVFKLKTDGSGFQAIHSFSGSDGNTPYASLIFGPGGTLYGTTYGGGANVDGTLFKLKTDGTGFQTLYVFNNSGKDGWFPTSSLIQGSDGMLYGTTQLGGSDGFGTVFKLSTDGSGLQTIYSFSGADGQYPLASLLPGSDGALYGTTELGGVNNDGTVFKLNPDGSAFQTLHSFSGNDGDQPYANLIQGSDGALYGTTWYGGANQYGTIFKLKIDGTGFQTLHVFSGSGSQGDGASPNAALLQGSDGALYGTTWYGGANLDGTIFKLKLDGSSFQTLHNFNGADGNDPHAALIQGTDGTLYGTARIGGTNDGTVFRLNADGSGFQTIYTFSGSDGSYPVGGLLFGPGGALYGTTQQGGVNNDGTVFKLSPDGSGFQTLYSFSGADGYQPDATLIQGADGSLYGTTQQGGVYGLGTAFQLIVPNTFAISGFSPDPVKANTALTLTINGAGFQRGATVQWNSAAHTLKTTFVNSGQITASVPSVINPPLNAYPGVARITVLNPDGTHVSANLTIAVPTPVLTQLAPSVVPIGSPDTLLTLTGNAFAPGAVVNWNGAQLSTTFVSPTQLQATLPAANLTKAAKVSVSVTNPSGGGTSKALTLTVTNTAYLVLAAGTPTRDGSNNVVVPLTLNNVGAKAADGVQITDSTLHSVKTSTSLPASLGNIGTGSSASVDLTYPGSAGNRGQKVTVVMLGSYTPVGSAKPVKFSLTTSIVLP